MRSFSQRQTFLTVYLLGFDSVTILRRSGDGSDFVISSCEASVHSVTSLTSVMKNHVNLALGFVSQATCCPILCLSVA